METQTNNKFGNWIKKSITARMLMVGFLTLVLIIPLSFIESLITERSYRKVEVINEINEKWGNSVVLSGPILKIPYKAYTEIIRFDQKTGESTKEQETHIKLLYLLPEKLSIDSEVEAQQKNRSIYSTTVFNSSMKCNGTFSKPDFTKWDIKEEDVVWDKASVIINTSNLKGIRNEVKINFNGSNYSFVPKYKTPTKNYDGYSPYEERITMQQLESEYLKPESAPIDSSVNFSFDFNVNGSQQVSFVPLGKETKVTMKSNWTSPNFFGNFLPVNNEEDRVNENGFNADWEILQINRQFEQHFFDTLPDLSEFAFGVKLIVPVDEYQKSERTAKYGFLVIALTFLVFFLIQTLSKINIHPFQYLMIGLALTMFYTLLISITEHSSYLTAYLIAGSAVVVLISLYSKSILKNIKFPLFIGASLTALYAFIFVIIQLESYALLVGSIGLFFILSIVMYFSRKIDWQND